MGTAGFSASSEVYVPVVEAGEFDPSQLVPGEKEPPHPSSFLKYCYFTLCLLINRSDLKDSLTETNNVPRFALSVL